MKYMIELKIAQETIENKIKNDITLENKHNVLYAGSKRVVFFFCDPLILS